MAESGSYVGPGPFSRYLYQSQSGDSIDPCFASVVPEQLLQLVDELVVRLFCIHVDKIYDNYPANGAKPELPGYLLRCFHICLEDRVVQVFGTDKFSGIYINHRKGLGLINDKICSGRKPDLPVLQLQQLVFDVVYVKYRGFTFVEVYFDIFAGKETLCKRLDIIPVLFSIYNYLVYVLCQIIPQNSLQQAKILVYQAWGTVFFCVVLYGIPLGEEILYVIFKAFFVAALCHCPDYYSEAIRTYLFRYRSQAGSLVIILYSFGYACLMSVRDEHHVPACQRYPWRDTGSFALSRIFDYLDQHFDPRFYIDATHVIKIEKTIPSIPKV
ncbi:hypothetical protein SDC9_133859 [bioreactor metagenome]|uniref:Uncharacterized protein n=1 Tax=bioreactor metagenome TaxID=1076179 RepID=A0A645DC49_9ZZZZ